MDNEDFNLGIADSKKGKDTFQDHFKTDLGGNTLEKSESSLFSDLIPITLLENDQAVNQLTNEWHSAFVEKIQVSDTELEPEINEGIERKDEEIMANYSPSEKEENFVDDIDWDKHEGTDGSTDMAYDEKEPELPGLQATSTPFFELAHEIAVNEKVSDDDANSLEAQQENDEPDRDIFEAETVIAPDGHSWPQDEIHIPQNKNSTDHIFEETAHIDYPDFDPMIREDRMQEIISPKHNNDPFEGTLTITAAKEVFEKTKIEVHVAVDPVTKKATVYCSKTGKKKLLLVDSFGTTIDQWVVEGEQFEMPIIGRPLGIYFLKIQAEGEMIDLLKWDVV